MNLRQTRLHILHKPGDLNTRAATGVSLHCHTLHSKEILDFIPYYATRIPVLSYFWRKECRRYLQREGRLPNFTTGYWEPPLTGEQVFQSEVDQMNAAGLDAIVSITDHDCIDANLELNNTIPGTIAPISMEWTVPFRCAFFHLGIHNLPPQNAVEIKERLLAYTYDPELKNDSVLHDIFSMLNSMPEVLIIFNHPVWDIEMIGQELHMKQLDHFVKEHGKWIHALEINGFRSWSENKQVIDMAESLGFPLVSGGDRHCCNHNTMINLTDSKTFAEFVDEIRVDRHSEVVIMPEYHVPLAYRQVRSMAQILTDYPEFPAARQRWIDRVVVDLEDNEGLQPLSYHWRDGSPGWTGWLMRALGICSDERLQGLYHLITSREDIVPRQPAAANPAPRIGRSPITIDG